MKRLIKKVSNSKHIDIFDTGINEFNNEYDLETTSNNDEEYNEPYKSATFENVKPSDLINLDDKINDTINLSETPEYDRIGLWVYYKGKIYTSFNYSEVTHNTIIKNLKEKEEKKKAIRNQRSYSYLDDPRVRLNEPVAYGHICNGNVCIIDSECNGTRVNNSLIVAALKQKFGTCKIYSGEIVGKLDLTKVKRLAKRLK